VVKDGRLGGSGCPCVVVGCDHVQELCKDAGFQAAGSALDQSQPEMDVTEQAALGRRQEERAAVELLASPGVVEKCCGKEDVGAQPRMELSGFSAESRHRDRVLEQPSCPGVMALDGRRQNPQAVAKGGVGDEAADYALQPRMCDLGGEELEEAVELVDVPARGRNERGRVRLSGLERANVELEAVAKALHPPEYTHGVALVEAAVEELDVVPDAGLDSSTRIDELEREIRTAGARSQPLLPRHGEEPLHDPVLCQLCDRGRDGHRAECRPKRGW
jgi:hypothetical protein